MGQFNYSVQEIQVKTTQALLLLVLTSLFFGCANIDDSKTEEASALINFHFAPHATKTVTTFTSNGLTWSIEKASMLPGEIGIHWDRPISDSRSEQISPVAPRHDVNGKISPKFYGYFAVDLLDTVNIAAIQIPEKHYNHIHMIVLPDSAKTSTISTTGIENHPELLNNSLVISGTVSNGTTTKRFQLENNISYGENDLGDILIDFSAYKDDNYNIYIHPLFDLWFSEVEWDYLAQEDTTTVAGKQVITSLINSKTNYNAFMSIENSFTSDNAMSYTFDRVK